VYVTDREKERKIEINRKKKIVVFKLRGKKFTVVTSPKVDRLPVCKHFFPVRTCYIPLRLICSGFPALILQGYSK
jgi:hypothetical protein